MGVRGRVASRLSPGSWVQKCSALVVLSWKRPSPGRIFTQWMQVEAWALSYLHIRYAGDPSDLGPCNSQEKGGG